MKISHLLKMVKEAGLTPEELGKPLGLSGMTLRRWMKQAPTKDLPKFYERAFADEGIRLWMDGLLQPRSEIVQWALAEAQILGFQAVIKSLGVTLDLTQSGDDHDRLMVCLAQVGSHEKHRQEVDRNSKAIHAFGKRGEDWARWTGSLSKVVLSKRLDPVDKMVAYGALYYLLCPIDLIPDSIPVFGLIDDFAILGLAAGYYSKRRKGKA
jgi:uncharacterized membrane protein YkvA (DUF1232 family)